VRLLTESPDDAAMAADVVAWRVENMSSPFSPRPYSELMTLESAMSEMVSGDVATLDFSAVGPIGFWYQMVYSLDLWPFAWMEG
jgi:hypothetical protein